MSEDTPLGSQHERTVENHRIFQDGSIQVLCGAIWHTGKVDGWNDVNDTYHVSVSIQGQLIEDWVSARVLRAPDTTQQVEATPAAVLEPWQQEILHRIANKT